MIEEESITPEEAAVIEGWTNNKNPGMIPLPEAVLCEQCRTISAANGEICPQCHAVGSLISLARIIER